MKNKKVKICSYILLGVVIISALICSIINLTNQTKKEEEKQNLVQFSEFEDVFEKAMFVYGWFYSNETLSPYLDNSTVIEPGYELLKTERFKTIQDMKNYAYEVFSKELVDEKFKEMYDFELIKESEYGVLVNSGYVSQWLYDTGYSSYNKEINQDGTISYKVHISSTLMGESSCDTNYEYKMEKNNEGNFIFVNFEVPANICLNNLKDN